MVGGQGPDQCLLTPGPYLFQFMCFTHFKLVFKFVFILEGVYVKQKSTDCRKFIKH